MWVSPSPTTYLSWCSKHRMDGVSVNQRAIKVRQDRLFFEPGANQRSGDKPEAESLAPAEQSALPVYAGAAEPKHLSNGFFVYSYILGRIDYIDVFGTPHWTHFLLFRAQRKGRTQSLRIRQRQG